MRIEIRCEECDSVLEKDTPIVGPTNDLVIPIFNCITCNASAVSEAENDTEEHVLEMCNKDLVGRDRMFLSLEEVYSILKELPDED